MSKTLTLPSESHRTFSELSSDFTRLAGPYLVILLFKIMLKDEQKRKFHLQYELPVGLHHHNGYVSKASICNCLITVRPDCPLRLRYASVKFLFSKLSIVRLWKQTWRVKVTFGSYHQIHFRCF